MLVFGYKVRVEILSRLYLTELEKFMMSPVQTNGGTFQRNSTLRTKGLEELQFKSKLRMTAGGMDPRF